MYEFTKLQLTQNEFNNLVFMGPPPWWENEDEDPPGWDQKKQGKLPLEEQHRFLFKLCHKPLLKVAKKVIERSGLQGPNLDPTRVFQTVRVIARGEETPWFERHACLSQRLHKNLMEKIWIRNLTHFDGGERDKCPNGTFYIEDGNHRALVYAMHVECGALDYEPVAAIHATSWDLTSGILGHPVQSAHVLENNGRLQDNNKHLVGQFQMHLDRYERLTPS